MHKEVAHYKYTYDQYNIHSLRLIMILNYFIHYCSIYTILKHTECKLYLWNTFDEQFEKSKYKSWYIKISIKIYLLNYKQLNFTKIALSSLLALFNAKLNCLLFNK